MRIPAKVLQARVVAKNIADLLMYVNARLWIGQSRPVAAGRYNHLPPCDDLPPDAGKQALRNARRCSISRSEGVRALLSRLPVCALGRGKTAEDAVAAAVLECQGYRRKRMTILLIGAGRMGSALLEGWRAKSANSIIVVEPKPSAGIKKLAKAKAITLVDLSSQVNRKVTVCIVAIKPQVLKGEAGALANIARSGALMISIAAGTSVATLRQAWGAKARIVRAMPNTPGAIGRGITGLFAAKGVTPADQKRADALLSALGKTVWVAKEGLIDSVTALSRAQSPAYVFHLVEALTEAGIAVGLKPALAEKLARATVAGAGALLDAQRDQKRLGAATSSNEPRRYHRSGT